MPRTRNRVLRGERAPSKARKFKERPAKPPINKAEGVAGFEVQMYGWDNLRDADEYNPDLYGASGITVYNKMARNDPTIQAMLLSLELPVTNAEWTIQEPKDPEKLETECSEWLQWAVFEGMEQEFDSVLRLAMESLKCGFSLGEKIYDYDAKKRCFVKSLAPREQSTIKQWVIDNNENLTAFKQQVYSGVTRGTYNIPRWKTVLFVNRPSSGSPKGQSILRAAYKPWKRKEKFEKYQNVQFMRHAVGIPKIVLPKNVNASDKVAAANIAKNLRAHQQSYAIFPEGWEVDFMDQGQSKFLDILPGIKYCDDQMIKAVLAQFLNLGEHATGSYALGESFVSIFLQNLEATAKSIARVINRELIGDLIEMNFPGIEQGRRPKIVVSGIITEAYKEMAEAYSALFTSGAVTHDEITEDAIRERMHLPLKDKKAQKEEDEPEQDEKDENGDGVTGQAMTLPIPLAKKAAALPSEIAGYPILQKREIRPSERYVTWKMIEGSLDSGTGQIVTITQDSRQQILDLLQQQIIDVLKSGQPGEAFKIAVPDEMERATAESIKTVLTEMYDYGRQTVKDEQRRQQAAQKKAAELKKPPKVKKVSPTKSVADPKNAEAILEAMSVRLGQRVWQQVENSARDLVIAQLARGQADVESIMESIGELSSKKIETSASNVVNEAFGKGRAYQIEEVGGDIQYVELSSMLDMNTCEECARLDMELGPILVGSPEYDRYMPPLVNDCLGGGRCRCVYVATFEESAPEA